MTRRKTPKVALEIRPLRTSDFEALIGLFDSVAAERRWIGTEPGFNHDNYREVWSKQIDGTYGAAFIAMYDGVLGGFIGTVPHADYGTIFGMMIHSSLRGRGIGTALMKAVIDWAILEGLEEISLLVFPHNKPAINLYRKFGFVDREFNKNDVTRKSGEVWDSIAMTKKLRS